jgi:ABC-type Fe3+-hydroxamate transport system substrate-binding protein
MIIQKRKPIKSITYRPYTYYIIIICVFSLIAGTITGVLAENSRVITDMRNKEITIPGDTDRVVIIQGESLNQIIKALGVCDHVRGIGQFTTIHEAPRPIEVTCLNPFFQYLPNIYRSDRTLDEFTIMVIKPDVVIWEEPVHSDNVQTEDQYQKDIAIIENRLKVPVVVINGSQYTQSDNVIEHYPALEILGEIFHKKERTEEIIRTLNDRDHELEVFEHNNSKQGSALVALSPDPHHNDARHGWMNTILNLPLRHMNQIEGKNYEHKTHLDPKEWGITYLMDVYQMNRNESSLWYDAMQQ